MSRPITTSSGCTGRDVHGGEVSAGVVSGLVAPTAPDNHRWETLWHYMQSGPGMFKGDLHFYKVDGDIRGKIDEIDARRCPLYLLTGEYDYSCTTEGTLDIAQAHRRAGHHHEGPRPFPDERGPAEVHRLSAAGAGEDSRRGKTSAIGAPHVPRRSRHTLQPAAGATDADRQLRRRLRYDALPTTRALRAAASARHRRRDDRRRAGGTIATQAENVIEAVRPAGKIPVPGRARRADLLDAAFLGGTAAHGIELDDGYRHRLGALRLRRRAGGAQRRLRPRASAAAR